MTPEISSAPKVPVAILFDLDGTLHDRERGIAAFASDQFSRLGKNRAELTQYVSRFVQLDAGGRVWKDRVYSQLVREFELVGHCSAERLLGEYVSLYPGFATEVAGAAQVLSRLRQRGARIGIITNGRSVLQSAVISALGFRNLLDAIVISEQAGCRKPERKIFELALCQLGVASERAMMVGDDPVSDVEGATNAGLRSVAFRCHPDVPSAIPAATMAEVLAAAEAFLDELNPLGRG